MEGCLRCVLRLLLWLRGADADVSCMEGNPVFVPRVLEVVKGKLCYIVGTVYMDMPLKPNVLEDIARDVRPLSSTSRLPPANPSRK